MTNARVGPPPGWYPDNLDARRRRYWDGQAWTPRTRPARRFVTGATVAVVALVLAVLWGVGAVAGEQDPPGTPGPDPQGGSSVSSESDDATERDAARRDRQRAQAQRRARAERREAREAREARERREARREARRERLERERRAQERREQRARQQASRATYVVTRVVDGDTLELGNGETVRLVGIDTPEVGDCGFEQASARLGGLVLGRNVTLGESDEDRDYYGRLLRYVDVAGADAGLTLIREGLAIARYDSRDGYGWHPREATYVAADRDSARGPGCRRQAPVPLVGNQGEGQGQGACAPGYQPCVPPAPPDLDCADLSGPIRVTGTDPHGLDGDGDGVACE